MQTDNIYAQARAAVAEFRFNEEVVAVFPDMIARSVPGYDNVIATTGLLAAEHLPVGGLAFDLGCSLGATSYALLAYQQDPDVRVVGIDNSASMIKAAKAQQVSRQLDLRVSFREADLLQEDYQGADVVLLNYVLQFIDPDQRLNLLRQLRQQLAPDGMILLSEKIRYNDVQLQRQMEQAHWAFKRANGYSELEISQKRQALDNIMIVDTEQQHRERLAQAGFTRVSRWFQCLNWASFIIQA